MQTLQQNLFIACNFTQAAGMAALQEDVDVLKAVCCL